MNSSDIRAERLRRVNRFKAVQSELARQKEEAEFNARREERLRAAEADAALAAELAEEQRRDIKDEKMLQFVRDFPEIRQLEHVLKDAYLQKMHAEQVIDKTTTKKQEIKEQREYLNFLDEQDRKAKELEERKRQKEMERFRTHQAAQLEIIKHHQLMAQEEAKERLRERVSVDAVVARVQEKDFLDSLAKRERQRQLQEEQDEFYRIRAELKKAEQERQAKEEAAIQAYVAEQNRRKEADEKMLRERDRAKANILEDQSRRIAEEQRKKQELEDLLHDYYAEERLAKEQALMRAEKESRERMCAAISKDNLELIQQRREAREKEAAEETAYRQKLMEELAEKFRLDQVNKQLQMQRKKEMIAEAQRCLEERQKQKEAEHLLANQVNELERKREEELQAYIQRARAQLLEEHLPKLGRFAPVNYLKPHEKERFLNLQK